MATILLVHGSWHGGWVWNDLRSALLARGHAVHAPSLRGLGEDAVNLCSDIGLWTHIEDLEGFIVQEDLRDLVLVGHSYGGAIVHGLEGRVAHRLRAVVHLEGAIPAPGSSIMDGWREDYRREVLTLASAHGGWLVPPPDPGVWTGLNDGQRQWMHPKLKPQSLKTYQDTMPVNLKLFTGPHIYLWAMDRPTQPYRAVVERFRHEPNWMISRTRGGHELPLTNPTAVLRTIDAAVAGVLLPAEI
ncbi:MAG: alpha/beta hydrolase [Pseudomonadota bacterium]